MPRVSRRMFYHQSRSSLRQKHLVLYASIIETSIIISDPRLLSQCMCNVNAKMDNERSVLRSAAAAAAEAASRDASRTRPRNFAS